MKPLSKNIFVFLLIVLGLGLIFAQYDLPTQKPETIGTSELVQKIESGEVTHIQVTENTLTIDGQDGKVYTSSVAPNERVSELLTNYGVSPETLVKVNIEYKDPSVFITAMRSFLPSLLFLIGFGVLFFIIMRQMQGANNRAMSFGQSNAREFKGKKGRVTFKDVAGGIEAKEELKEIVDFLKTPKKYADVGAKIPKGVLLMGPPGTGKTLMARAVAGEANVPFFHISGSEFVEMFVGVGASRVRDLFAKAKKAAPCLIFMDEIDAVGRQRGAGLGGGHDEREQTLNQILVEMDGFEANNGVIVVAATNRPDVLDPALLRPGRFDRRVTLDLPSLKDREAILTIHTDKKPLAKDVDLHRIAERTIGFSGADIMNVMNEAAILAARKSQKTVTQGDVLEAIEKVMLGPERKSHVLSDPERKLTAYHEAGHAIVGHMLPNCDDVHKISIISRGMAAGYTMSLPTEDKKMHFRQEFIEDLAMMLGGYAAEREVYDDFTTGASNDLEKATRTARSLVTRYGMSEKMGPRTYGQSQDAIFLGRGHQESRDYSEQAAEDIDAEVTRLLTEARETATRIIKENRPALEKIVAMLLEKETIEKEEFEKLIGEPKRAAVKEPKK